MSSTRLAVVLSNDEPDSDYGARRLATSFGVLFRTELVNALDGFERPASWLEERGADVLVLSGSDRSVTDGSHWMLEEEEVLRAAVAGGVPTLAICFGHQLLAKAFGSEIIRRDKQIGLSEVTPVGSDEVFRGLGERIVVPQQHADQVADLPDDFELIATSDYCHVQAFRHRSSPVYGMQFHPCYDATVFDVDEVWANLGGRESFVHDGPAVLKNVVGMFAETFKRG